MRVEPGAEQRNPLVPQQAHEVVFRQEFRCGRVERGIAMRQGEGAVPRHGAAGFHAGLFQGFRGQAFDRVAIQAFDAHGGAAFP